MKIIPEGKAGKKNLKIKKLKTKRMKQIRFFFQKIADSNFPRLSFLKSKTVCVSMSVFP